MLQTRQTGNKKITHYQAANFSIHHKRGIAEQTQWGVQSVRGVQTCSMQQCFFEPRLQTFGLWETTTGHIGLFSFMVCSVIVPEQGLLLLMMLLLLLLLLPCKEFQGSVHQGGVIV